METYGLHNLRSMPLKRYIALVLCALYMAATASVSLASLTCRCLDMKQSGTGHHHAACCTMLDPAAGSTACRGGDLGTGCDCDLHSTRIDLYTSSHSNDNDKLVKCIISELPPSLTVECPPAVALHEAAKGAAWRAEVLPDDVAAACAGRRAPPLRG